jgi:hypothetical protein
MEASEPRTYIHDVKCADEHTRRIVDALLNAGGPVAPTKPLTATFSKPVLAIIDRLAGEIAERIRSSFRGPRHSPSPRSPTLCDLSGLHGEKFLFLAFDYHTDMADFEYRYASAKSLDDFQGVDDWIAEYERAARASSFFYVRELGFYQQDKKGRLRLAAGFDESRASTTPVAESLRRLAAGDEALWTWISVTNPLENPTLSFEASMLAFFLKEKYLWRRMG